MREVTLLVTFIIESLEDEEAAGELSENDAKSAASFAAWNNLTLTKNGRDMVESVEVHVDGFGTCRVTLGEEHE